MSERVYKKLDFSGLNFPSDSLTIRTLRTKHSELFDKGFSVGGGDEQPQFFFNSKFNGPSQSVLGGMLYLERTVAAFAFSAAAGIEPPRGQVSMPETEHELAEKYITYGLASGPKHAAELIRGIKRQGQGLAADRRR